MNKILIVFLAICIGITYSNSQEQKPCWGEDCTFDVKGDPLSKATVVDAVRTIDREMRRVYWYYLRNARRLFQANVDTPTRFIHFYIYRNIVGTFLAIGSWDHATQIAEVNTFVRLGNGYSEDVPLPYEPVDIDPFVISLKLQHGEFLIEIDQNGDVICQEGVFNEFCKEDETLVIVDQRAPIIQVLGEQKVAAIDDHLRVQYWYYLRNAKIIHSEAIPTNRRVYGVFTYINIVGTFLVIASCDSNDVIQVNTFVRLGAGSANVEEIEKGIILEPKIIAAE